MSVRERLPGAGGRRLAISDPRDHHEVEAERIAEHVTRLDGVDSMPSGSSRVSHVGVEAARQVEDVMEASTDEEDDIVADETGMPSLDGAVPQRNRASTVALPHAAGQPFDHVVRAQMERRIGHDFGDVRVHADAEAASAARRVGASAFTVGRDIYFGSGKYDAATREGRRLLAHELVHVVQQTAAGPPGADVVQRRPVPGGERRRRPPGQCDGPCAPSKAPLHDGCNNGGPAAVGDWITGLLVKRAGHRVIATWNSGKTDSWPCSPSTKRGANGKVPTPLVKNDHVGVKCDQCHTNRHGDGMGWFTGLGSQGRAIGFHNSQLVGPGHESHGCIRVSCDVARTIQEHSSTGTTTIDAVP